MGQLERVAERWAKEGWEVTRVDFSHNGHVPPFLETYLDEEAWSANRYHIERDEVAHALAQIDQGDLPIVVMGHSRGGAMAMLGAQQHVLQGGRMDGISLWAPVAAPLVSRLPKGAALEAWKSSNRLEVLNGLLNSTLVHPFAFYTDTMQRAEELSVERAAKATSRAQHWSSMARWIQRCTCEGGSAFANGRPTVHSSRLSMQITYMRHPWPDAMDWPTHLEEAWHRHREWLESCLDRHINKVVGMKKPTPMESALGVSAIA